MKYAPLTFLCLAALTLGACERGSNTMAANAKICIDFKQAKAPPAAPGADGPAGVEQCVQRWAYSLAPSRDDADVVAEAVVGACNPQLTRWNRQALATPDGEAQAASLTTGELTSPIGEHVRFAQTRALLYVVQARAGACAPPPATNGVPEGIG